MSEGASEGAPGTPEVDALPSFDEFIESTCGKLVAATKAAAFLSSADFALQAASSREFGAGLKTTSSRLLGIANRLLAYSATGAPAGSAKRKAKAAFEDIDQVTDRFGPVVDAIDDLLERTDTALDIVNGKRLPALPPPPDRSSSLRDMHHDSRSRGKAARLDPKLYNAAHLMRPQLKFEDTPNNDNGFPVPPKIKVKPNAVIPLPEDLSAAPPNFHAYEHEIKNISYPAHLFEFVEEPHFVADMTETPFTWVDTLPALESMCAKLEKADEIAVDTEHHSYRSFQGFICLIQISTREEDFVIDALALRKHLHLLNSSFTNPKIIKILHGADMDVQWLQRDFGVYLVGLFDTYHASHVLEMPQHSYAYLLKFYCDIDADKKYQLADWRIRPVPQEMLSYARSDTHYLHYIYDRMKTELIRLSPEGASQLLLTTMARSATTALKIYTKEIYDIEGGEGPNGWRKALEKHRGPLVPRQVTVFKRVHAWRDRVAREEDESTAYVLPARLLGTIAEAIPTTDHDLRKVCSPMPPLVQTRMAELIKTIRAAVKEAADEMKQATAMAAEAKPTAVPDMKPAEAPKLDDSLSSSSLPNGNETAGKAGDTVLATPAPADDMVAVPNKEPSAVVEQPKPKPKVAKIVLAGNISAPMLKHNSAFFDGLGLESRKKAEIPVEVLSSLAAAIPSPPEPAIEVEEVAPAPAKEPQVEKPAEPEPEPLPSKTDKKKFNPADFQVDTMLSPKKKKARTSEKAIEPFDYSATKSKALESILAAPTDKTAKYKTPKFNMDEMEFEVSEDKETKKDMAKIKSALADGKAPVAKKKGDVRAHIAPKSGSKSMTFTVGAGKKK